MESNRLLSSPIILTANNSLQRTFDPPPIFASAKTGIASYAAQLNRLVPGATLVVTLG